MKTLKHNTPIISVTQRGTAIPVEQDFMVKFGISIRNRPFDYSVYPHSLLQ